MIVALLADLRPVMLLWFLQWCFLQYTLILTRGPASNINVSFERQAWFWGKSLECHLVNRAETSLALLFIEKEEIKYILKSPLDLFDAFIRIFLKKSSPLSPALACSQKRLLTVSSFALSTVCLCSVTSPGALRPISIFTIKTGIFNSADFCFFKAGLLRAVSITSSYLTWASASGVCFSLSKQPLALGCGSEVWSLDYFWRLG